LLKINVFVICNSTGVCKTVALCIPEKNKTMKLALIAALAVCSLSLQAQDTSAIKKPELKNCPVCHSNSQVVPVVFGKPTAATAKKAEAGLIKLGGCRVPPDRPAYYCKKDNRSF